MTAAQANVYESAPAQTVPNGIRTFIHLPLRNESELEHLIQQQSTEGSPEYHRWLTPQQFRESYGPRTQDLQSAALALRSAGFTTQITSQGVFADAPQAVVERTFGVHLRTALTTTTPGSAASPTLVTDRAPILPAALTKVNAQVVGLGYTHPIMPQIYKTSATPIPENRYSPIGPYWFDDLKQAYLYPSYAISRGAGRTIGIVATSNFLVSDYREYFAHEHLAPPSVTLRPVSGGPAKFNPNSSDSAEITADIQQAGGSAPGARLIVYGGPDDTDATFAAMYVSIDEDNNVDIVNTSFGSCELFYTPPWNGGVDFTGILRVFHELFLQGNSQGITFFNSSGDWGAKDCWSPNLSTAVIGVNNLASDPAVTGVGGTNLVTTTIKGSLRSSYVRENAFLDPMKPGQGPFGASGNTWGSAGGKSAIWPKPAYQYIVNTHSATRSVPDVSLHMGGCPIGAVTPCGPDRSFDVVVFDGGLFGFIGTSLSSPDFAGLQAVQQQSLGSGRQGNVNFLIYTLAKAGSVGNGPVFHNNIPGNNGYPSTPGYNFVLGNGTPYGSQYSFRPFGPFAGNPQTPSNP